MYWILTNAPADYDYPYVTDTGESRSCCGVRCRVVCSDDDSRMIGYQHPRYRSGAYVSICIHDTDLNGVESHGLGELWAQAEREASS